MQWCDFLLWWLLLPQNPLEILSNTSTVKYPNQKSKGADSTSHMSTKKRPCKSSSRIAFQPPYRVPWFTHMPNSHTVLQKQKKEQAFNDYLGTSALIGCPFFVWDTTCPPWCAVKMLYWYVAASQIYYNGEIVILECTTWFQVHHLAYLSVMSLFTFIFISLVNKWHWKLKELVKISVNVSDFWL